MEQKRMLGEKPMRVLQCYFMFYGEVPTYKSQKDYGDFYIKVQAMMSFLDVFGYSLLYQSEGEEPKRWYTPSHHLIVSNLQVSPEIDPLIHAFNQELEGKTKEEIQEYYQESLERKIYYDPEITARIGELVKEFASSRNRDIVDVLRDLTTPKSFKDRVEFKEYGDDLQDLMEYAKDAFEPITIITKEYSIEDPRYLQFLRKYLKPTEPNKEKRKEY